MKAIIAVSKTPPKPAKKLFESLKSSYPEKFRYKIKGNSSDLALKFHLSFGMFSSKSKKYFETPSINQLETDLEEYTGDNWDLSDAEPDSVNISPEKVGLTIGPNASEEKIRAAKKVAKTHPTHIETYDRRGEDKESLSQNSNHDYLGIKGDSGYENIEFDVDAAWLEETLLGYTTYLNEKKLQDHTSTQPEMKNENQKLREENEELQQEVSELKSQMNEMQKMLQQQMQEDGEDESDTDDRVEDLFEEAGLDEPKL